MDEKIEIKCPVCSHRMNIPVGKHIKFTCPKCKKELEYGQVLTNSDQIIKESQEEIKESSIISNVIILVIGIIISVPAFLILHKFLPNLDWIFGMDRIIMYVLILLILYFLLRKVKMIVWFISILALLFLAYGSITGGYGYLSIYRDYQGIVCKIRSRPIVQYIDLSKLETFQDKQTVRSIVDSSLADVKRFTNKTIIRYSYNSIRNRDYKTLLQCFIVYREISEKWEEVKGPEDRKIYPKLCNTVETLSGNNEDYTLLVATCIKSIGGEVRLVRTKDYLYPEIKIGTEKDIDKIHEIVVNKMFKSESYGKHFYYHKEGDGSVWLKIDRNGNYPGSDIEDDEVKSIMFL